MNAQWSFHSAPCSTHRLSSSISCGRERPPQRLRRHPVGLVLGGDPGDELALLEVPRHDRMPARLQLRERPVLRVQPQPRLAFPRIGPVAVEALVREDRPDLVVEVDLPGGGGLRGPGEDRRRDEDQASQDSHGQNAERVFRKCEAPAEPP